MLKVGDKVKFKKDIPRDVLFGWNEDMSKELSNKEFVISEIVDDNVHGHGTIWAVSEDMLERVNKYRVGDTVYHDDVKVTIEVYDGSDVMPYQLSNGWWVDDTYLRKVPKFKVGDKVKFKDHAQEGIGDIVNIQQGLYKVRSTDMYVAPDNTWSFTEDELTLVEEFTDVERSLLKKLVEYTLEALDSYEILRETLLSLHDKL